MADQTFVAMFDEVRQMTLRVLEGVDEESARWHPPGLANTILWHAGHNFVVLEWITAQSLGIEAAVPHGWGEMFGWDSHPAEIAPERFPHLATIIGVLQSQHARLRDLFLLLKEEDFERPSAAWPQRTVRQMILHAFQDEASHKGEIWLLRKLQAKRGGE
jgi:hypothetical protein